jgi:hypothetical protein
MSNTTVKVVVSDEVVNQLFIAFVGLSPVRQEAVNKQIADRKISRQQATLEEILYPRVAIYAKRGEEAQEEIMTQARTILAARGFTPEQIEAALNPAKE